MKFFVCLVMAILMGFIAYQEHRHGLVFDSAIDYAIANAWMIASFFVKD